MTNNDVLRRAVRGVLYANVTAAIAGISVAAAADSAAPEPTLQEVVVTGSRISQPGLESISPVTIISKDEIKQEGITRIEDLLNNLPQVFADQGGNISNGATGAANVNLRGLGVQRTLVLVNGRRLMPGDPTQNGNSAADLNQIPAALVESVEVLTGGASAVYGADAVAGVVNFKMYDHFEGFRIDTNATMNSHHQHEGHFETLQAAKNFPLPNSSVNDGKTKDITFILGGNFADGKGNVTAYAGYRRLDPLVQGARDFSNCSLTGGKTFGCGGSSTSATGAFYTAKGKLTVGPNGNFIPFAQGPGLYNYGATNYYQRSDERYTGGLFGHLDINEHAKTYTEVSFMHDETNAQVAASGAFIGSGTGVDANGIPTGKWVVNCNNPFLSASEQSVICPGAAPNSNTQVLFGRRNVEGGPRNDNLQHTSFRMVVGVDGDIAEGWKYDTYAQVGKTLYSENYTNDVSKSRLANALLVVTDPVTGQPTCAANAGGAGGAPGCAPYNIWSNGGVTPAAEAYISVPSFKTGETEERIVSANITGDLTKYGVKTPWAETGLGLSFGAEYRSEHMRLNPDIENLTNDLAGSGNPVLPINAGLSVKEFFTEERLALIQDKPFVKSLSVETGYRYSKYDLGFSTNTYKFGVDWAPTGDIRARGSYQRAVRAPNLQELYLERFVGNDGATDPCAGSSSSPPTATQAQCARTGLTAAQYGGPIPSNAAGQYNGQFSGNVNLKPEQSDTYSFGLVLTPRALPAFSATLDYFDIKVKNVISSYGADYTLNQCLNTGNPTFCSLVHRAPGSGSLWTSPSGYITDVTLNLGSLATRGVDLNTNYHIDMGKGGKLAFNLVGTYTQSLVTEPVPGFGSYDCAGLFGNTCGTPTPKWRHKLRTSWSTPWQGFDVSAQWRHINEVKNDGFSSNPLLNKAAVNATDAKLGSRDYLDLNASYAVYKGISMRVGINNLFDKDPPLIAGSDFGSAFVNGNTYPQVYDTLGRYVFLNITADF